MARLLFVCIILVFVFAGFTHGRPRRGGNSQSNRGGKERDFGAMKTKLQQALSKNSASAVLAALRSFPKFKEKMCSSTSQPSILPTTQAANTVANEQGYGWLFDLISTALAQNTKQNMKIVLKSNPKLRRELCSGLQPTSSSSPTTPSTPTQPKPTTRQPPPPPPVVATNPPVQTPAGGGSFVDVALRDEGKSQNRATTTTPTAPTRPSTGMPQADTPNDYSDEFLTIPAMRKRRSLKLDDAQEEDPLEQKKRATRHESDPRREFHIATVIPTTTILPVQDPQVAPSVVISASNLLDNGQFDETIMIYPDSQGDAIVMDHKDPKEKKEGEDSSETTKQQAKIDVGSKMASSRQQGYETKEVNLVQNKVPRRENTALGKTSKPNDVMTSKKELFMADETPEELPDEEDDELATTADNRKQRIASDILSDEVDELRREDVEKKKSPVGGGIKYEVDDSFDHERLTKRKENKKLKMKMKIGKILKKKNIFG